MEKQRLYVGSVGVKIVLDVCVDISQSTLRHILYKKPVKGVSGYWEAEIETERKISYVVTAGDIDAAGWWEFQSYVKTPDWELPGDKIQQLVEGPIIPSP